MPSDFHFDIRRGRSDIDDDFENATGVTSDNIIDTIAAVRAGNYVATPSGGSDGNALTKDSTAPTGSSWTSLAGLTPPMTIGARAISTGSVNTANPGTAVFDGVTLTTGDRLLLTGNGVNNGVYVFATSGTALTRATDNNSSAEMMTGLGVWVSEGTLYKDTMWRLTTDAPIVLGTTSLTFNSNPRSPGTGTSSFIAGQTAVASNSSTTAVGVSATASGSLDSAFGASATASGGSSLAVGQAAQATAASTTALGRNTQATVNQTIAVGTSAQALATQSIAIGVSAQVVNGENGGVAIGYQALCGTGPTPSGESLAIGREALAYNWRDTCVGFRAQAWQVSGTAVGRGAIAADQHCLALGRGAWTPTNFPGQIAMGVNATGMDLWMGSGYANRYWDPVGTGGVGTDTTRDPTLMPITIHGCDGFDFGGRSVTDGVLNSTTTVTSANAHWTVGDIGLFLTGTGIPAAATIVSLSNPNGSGYYQTAVISAAATATASGVTLTTTGISGWTPNTDTAGGNLIMMAGRSTGTAAGGTVSLQVSPASGSSNNVKNSAVKVVEAGVSGTASALGFFGTAPVAKPTGVAVTAAGVHAALVSLGLIAA